ncbi:hypothetical protein CPB83DRAFT_850776 [Crepidotus variabilis]|uniref:Mitochondrial fission 1 protein n=1 Tax=Crepidotus variabilis TaxID=179855 RepID=A0A9P6EKN7_9AGAR|nr:hypothetical protein CPB83DRAFT_850776 [Crepidotus variabilis]
MKVCPKFGPICPDLYLANFENFSKSVRICTKVFGLLPGVLLDLTKSISLPYPTKMPTEVPYAADAEISLTYDELDVLRLQYQKEVSQDHVTVQTKFNFAWGLVKSPVHEHQVQGVKLLQEIYRAEPTRRRECLYYLALGHYKMSNFEEAKKFNALLLEKEPSNMQAQSLAQLIDKGVTREGYIGMALVGGAAAVGTLVLAGLIRRATRD